MYGLRSANDRVDDQRTCEAVPVVLVIVVSAWQVGGIVMSAAVVRTIVTEKDKPTETLVSRNMSKYPHRRVSTETEYSDSLTTTTMYGPKPFIVTMRCCGAIYKIPRWRGVDYVPPHKCADEDDGCVDSPALQAKKQARRRLLEVAAAAANGATTLSRLDTLLPAAPTLDGRKRRARYLDKRRVRC